MCAISGIISSNSEAWIQEKLHKMVTMQHHRGPDNQGIYVSGQLGFGHNRLSLLDLSDNGNQPLVEENAILVFNGEIYNYLELKNQLPPRIYKSGTDTEVLFWCLRNWGIEKTLQNIKGMFAFAYYETNSRTLWLCRDRLGIKPLFYGFDKQQNFVFASESKAITNNFSFDYDPFKVLYSALGILEKSHDYTGWHNLNHIPPGHFLKYASGQIELNAYFQIIDCIDEAEYSRLNNSSFSDVVHELESLLSSSVKSMMVSDADMGCFVSGGIDSSLIAYHAKKCDQNIKLFTANVIGKYSEYQDTKMLASWLDSELVTYNYEKEFALRDLAKVAWHYEVPIVNHFNAIAFSNVAATARAEGVKAVLTGEGADELFLGYPKLLTRKYDALINGPFSLMNKFYSAIPGLKSYTNKTGRSEGLKDLFEIGVQNFTRQYLREEGLKRFDFIKNEKDRFDQYLSAQMVQEGLISLLWRNDRMGMINSIESRFPFLDERIINFAINLPTKYKIGVSNKFHNYKHPFLIDKRIVRKIASEKLPKRIVNKPKFGFATYDFMSLKIGQELFKGGVFAEILKLDSKGLNYMLSNSSHYHLGLMAAVEIWARLFIRNASIDDVHVLINNSLAFKPTA